jgi:hypothetical protein
MQTQARMEPVRPRYAESVETLDGARRDRKCIHLLAGIF